MYISVVFKKVILSSYTRNSISIPLQRTSQINSYGPHVSLFQRRSPLRDSEKYGRYHAIAVSYPTTLISSKSTFKSSYLLTAAACSSTTPPSLRTSSSAPTECSYRVTLAPSHLFTYGNRLGPAGEKTTLGLSFNFPSHQSRYSMLGESKMSGDVRVFC